MTITTRNKWNAEIASLYTRLHHGAVDDDPIIIDEVDEVDHIEHEYNSLNDGHRDEAEDNTKAKNPVIAESPECHFESAGPQAIEDLEQNTCEQVEPHDDDNSGQRPQYSDPKGTKGVVIDQECSQPHLNIVIKLPLRNPDYKYDMFDDNCIVSTTSGSSYDCNTLEESLEPESASKLGDGYRLEFGQSLACNEEDNASRRRSAIVCHFQAGDSTHSILVVPVVRYSTKRVVVLCAYCQHEETHYVGPPDVPFKHLDDFRKHIGTRYALCRGDSESPYIFAFPGDHISTETKDASWETQRDTTERKEPFIRVPKFERLCQKTDKRSTNSKPSTPMRSKCKDAAQILTVRDGHKDTGKVRVFKEVFNVAETNLSHKTYGRLVRVGLPTIHAISGFSRKKTKLTATDATSEYWLLNKTEMYDRTHKLARFLGHKLAPNGYDHEHMGFHCGSVAGCHVEIQLTVALASLNSFFCFGEAGDTELAALAKIQPGNGQRRARLILDAGVCHGCRTWLSLFGAAFGVALETEEMHRVMVDRSGKSHICERREAKIPRMPTSVRTDKNNTRRQRDQRKQAFHAKKQVNKGSVVKKKKSGGRAVADLNTAIAHEAWAQEAEEIGLRTPLSATEESVSVIFGEESSEDSAPESVTTDSDDDLESEYNGEASDVSSDIVAVVCPQQGKWKITRYST